jgi:hypothetical protein
MAVRVTVHDNLREDMKRRDLMITALRTTKAMGFIDGDGHCIYDGEVLRSNGFPEFIVSETEVEHKSDTSSMKSTIFDSDGMIIETLKGVAALSLHYAVARALLLEPGVDYRDDLLGRGYQARELARAIKEDLDVVKA